MSLTVSGRAELQTLPSAHGFLLEPGGQRAVTARLLTGFEIVLNNSVARCRTRVAQLHCCNPERAAMTA